MLKLSTDSDALLAWTEKTYGFRVDRLVQPIAIGLIDSASKKFRVAVIFDNFNGVNANIHVISDKTKRWMTKSFLFYTFRYAFETMGASRLTGLVDEDNVDALSFDIKLGFKLEGKMKAASGSGKDIYILRMFKDECRFL